ncbi:unnamed protein product [Caenorhabditis auriculariae]|uniref:Uncharacterized protein n=1 Tax=Caenorhabditis auriculariae TaxID=2777116 RepID=A0A8S1HCQ1_9PELO|nr:unnamed protein product [Caenorhabditis auriculariae]
MKNQGFRESETIGNIGVVLRQGRQATGLAPMWVDSVVRRRRRGITTSPCGKYRVTVHLLSTQQAPPTQVLRVPNPAPYELLRRGFMRHARGGQCRRCFLRFEGKRPDSDE